MFRKLRLSGRSLIFNVFATLALMSFGLLQAQTHEWTTPTFTLADWNDGANWDTADYPSAAGSVAILSGFTFSDMGTIRFQGAVVGALGGTIDATVSNASQTLRLGGGNLAGTFTFEALPDETAALIKSGEGVLRFFRALQFNSTTVMTVNNGLVEFSGDSVDFTGSGNITVEGSGGKAVIETAVSSSFGTSYSGNIAITNGGTLVVNTEFFAHSTETTSLTVADAGVLQGTGTINRSTIVSSGGTLAPGNGPGILTFGADLAFETGSHLSFQLMTNATTNRGVNFSGVNMTAGILDIEPGAVVDLFFNEGNVDFSDEFWGVNQSWLLFDGVLVDGELMIGSISMDSLGQEFSITGGSFMLTEADNNLYVQYIIPEPRAMAFLFGAGALLLGWLRRTSKRKQ